MACNVRLVRLAASYTSMAHGRPFTSSALKTLGPMDVCPNYVEGRVQPATSILSGQPFLSVTEPATGQVLCRLANTGLDGVNQAVSSAHSAFDGWSKTSGFERAAVLLKAAQIIRDNASYIANLEVQDCGKPLWEATFDVTSCADTFQYYGGLAQSHCNVGLQIPVSNAAFAYTRREPLGVCAAIGAWNFPFPVVSWKVAPALACGNTVVYKPSEFTPLTSIVLAEILSQAGLPEGCFNVVQGDGSTGNLLCSHPNVAKVSFTGSVVTGQKVMAACVQGLKKITLELGGKSPIIIFEDADLENAIKAVLVANFLSQGQVCSNATRVYLHHSIVSVFLERLVAATKALRVGDPMAEGTQVGATINKAHADKILSYIDTAKQEGAEILCGGERIPMADARLADGVYLSPCVIAKCTDTMKVVREEIFGAVACILEFDDQDEVIHRANDSMYGLAAGIFTKNLSRAHSVAARIHGGSVWINNYNLYPPNIPFGGYKMSGVGRENGLAVIEHYTQLKSVYVETGEVDNPFDCAAQ